MPSSCTHFRHLASRIDELSRKFVDDQALDEAKDPAGFQPDLDRLAAYRLLVHAEIEDFLEAKAKDNLANIWSRLSTNPYWMRQSPELFALAIAMKHTPAQESTDITKVSAYVKDILKVAGTAIGENNGVKSQSFVFLAICSGKTTDEIDGVLSASLNSYGKERGDVAHKSVTHSRSLRAPSAELNTARSLVSEIGRFYDVCP